MAIRMTPEQFRKKYFEKEKRLAELKAELDALKHTDKAQMEADFASAYDIPEGYRLVKGRRQKPKKKPSK